MGIEGIEALRPCPSVGVEPFVELDESLRSELVHPSLGDRFGRYESSGAEHLQMLGHCWLAEGKSFHQLSYRLTPIQECSQDRPAVWFGDDLKDVHLPNMPDWQYARQGIWRPKSWLIDDPDGIRLEVVFDPNTNL